MNQELLTALRVSFFTLFLTGLVYPLLVTKFSDVLFQREAGGSLIYNEQNRMIGSELIGQNFKSSVYFSPRPSAAGQGYNGALSQGSNLGPTSKKLLKRVQEEVDKIQKNNLEPIPIDLVTMSASGLDPHISPQAAYWQAPRIALERNVSLKRVITIIDAQTEPPQFEFIGQSRVNVLKLNLLLDQFFGSPLIP